MARVNEYIRFEPDDRCPPLIAIGVAAQGVMLTLANVVVFVTITARAAGEGEDYLAWAVFSALIIAGAITALQAAKAKRLGAGHLLMSGAGPHFIALSIAVLTVAEAGLATLASLFVAASIVQFALAAWLPLLRRIVTPVVSGIALMLIAVMVMSIGFERLTAVPEGSAPGAGIVVATVTLAVSVMLAMRATGVWRFWAPVIGIATGCLIAAALGLYDPQPLAAASWIDIPDLAAWPGLDLTPGVDFWTFLPAFLIGRESIGLDVHATRARGVVEKLRPNAPTHCAYPVPGQLRVKTFLTTRVLSGSTGRMRARASFGPVVKSGQSGAF